MMGSQKPQSEANTPQANIGVAFVIFAVTFICFRLDHLFLISTTLIGQFLLGVGVYGLIDGITHLTKLKDQSQNIAVTLAIFTWIGEWVWSSWGQVIPLPWIILGTFAIVIVAFAAIQPLLKREADEHKSRVRISLLICLVGIAFFACYVAFVDSMPSWLGIAILFLSASTLRQGIHNVLIEIVQEWRKSWLLAMLPEIITLAVLFALAEHSSLNLCFHVGVVVLAIALFKYSSELPIQEIDAAERSKIGNIGVSDPPITFFDFLKELYGNVNILLLALLVSLVIFDLPQKLINPTISATVFQASLALLGIVVSFALLILQQRKPKTSTDAAKRQKYILDGLTGIGIIYIVVAVVAFISSAITPAAVATLNLPDLVEVSPTDILSNENKTFALLVLGLNEWIYFAVPLSLGYIYAIIRDFVTQF